MSTSYCPECGAEYVAGVAECADCGVALVAGPPPSSDDDGDDEEVAYELGDWEPDLRRLLATTLAGERIPFLWEEDGELVVRAEDSDRVDQILDELEYPDALEVDDSPPAVDEGSYEALSDLFVAADRLAHDAEDPYLADELAQAAGVVVGSGPPFGFAPEEWARIQGLADDVADAITGEADADVIAGGARSLRDVLRKYV